MAKAKTRSSKPGAATKPSASPKPRASEPSASPKPRASEPSASPKPRASEPRAATKSSANAKPRASEPRAATKSSANAKPRASKPTSAAAKKPVAGIAIASQLSPREVVAARLAVQQLAAASGARPAEVVARLGAVQAQDYLGALWGIAQRCAPAATEAAVEAAVAAREIARGWPMRGTLHFTAAADLRWMTSLLAARIVRRTARYKELGLDEAAFAACRRAAERALAGGGVLARDEMYALFANAGVPSDGQRGIHVLGYLAMTGTLCFGPRRGKQFTFTLVEEWLPSSRALAGDEALGELAARYFAGHGPATADDLAWWTGLNRGECARAIAAAGAGVVERGGYYTSPEAPSPTGGPRVYLLPPWDEYTVGYRDRSALLPAAHAKRLGNGIFSPVVVVDGQVAGTWKRTRKQAARGDTVAIACELVEPPSRAIARELEAAAERYGAFLGAAPSLTF